MKKNHSPLSIFKWLFCLIAIFIWLDGHAQTVYVTKTGKKYHADGCQYLRKSAYSMTYADAVAAGYDACSRCSGGIVIKSTGTTETKKQRPAAAQTGTQCQGITKKGIQCSRRVKDGGSYCFQHGG